MQRNCLQQRGIRPKSDRLTHAPGSTKSRNWLLIGRESPNHGETSNNHSHPTPSVLIFSCTGNVDIRAFSNSTAAYKGIDCREKQTASVACTFVIARN